MSVRIVSVAVAVPLDLMDDTDVPWVVASHRDDEARKREEAKAVDETLARLRALLEKHPAPKHARIELLAPPAAGSVGETLLAAIAQGREPGLCVVGARGLGTFKRLLAGVADAFFTVRLVS